jgi:type IV pilus assembly protein PilV
MKTLSPLRQRQTGAYLLEALIGMLIFALGVLGIVGLQAASLRATTDAALRAEAVFAANQLLGQMWADDETQLVANYSSAFNQQPYKDFASQLKTAQGGAWVADPAVVFDAVAAPSQTSHYVVINIQWQSPDPTQPLKRIIHNYTTSGVIGQN